MDKPTTEPAKAGNLDIEAFSRNIARLIEEGGKALAAYMKPREEGKIKGELAEDITDAVKSVSRVAEYWMSDPRRALELLPARDGLGDLGELVASRALEIPEFDHLEGCGRAAHDVAARGHWREVGIEHDCRALFALAAEV